MSNLDFASLLLSLLLLTLMLWLLDWMFIHLRNFLFYCSMRLKATVKTTPSPLSHDHSNIDEDDGGDFILEDQNLNEFYQEGQKYLEYEEEERLWCEFIDNYPRVEEGPPILESKRSILRQKERREIKLHFLDIKNTFIENFGSSHYDGMNFHMHMAEFENILELSPGDANLRSLMTAADFLISEFHHFCEVYVGCISNEDFHNDLYELKKRIKALIEDRPYEYSQHNPEAWHNSKKCLERINRLHLKEACIPPGLKTNKQDFEVKIDKLKRFLERQGFCKRLEYTGSVYEKVNIAGDTVEFDIMFVADGNWIRFEVAKPGFVYLTPVDDMHHLEDYLDKYENLDPLLYQNYFEGFVQRWLNINAKKELDGAKMKLHKHGVAVLVDVCKTNQDLTNGTKPWYQMDLVPCYEINSKLYVPKPDDEHALIKTWRRSYSVEERQLLKYGCLGAKSTVSLQLKLTQKLRRKGVRIVKAIFKCRTRIFRKTYTSYHIKTTMFHFYKRSNIIWNEKNFGSCFMEFFKEIRNCLEKKELWHYFEPEINLLKDLDETKRKHMVGVMNNMLKFEYLFYSVITC